MARIRANDGKVQNFPGAVDGGGKITLDATQPAVT
jgi:hypothetical protein